MQEQESIYIDQQVRLITNIFNFDMIPIDRACSYFFEYPSEEEITNKTLQKFLIRIF